MLVRQFQFPLEFDEELDWLEFADDDRLAQHHGHDFCDTCFKEHTGNRAMNLEKWLRWDKPSDEQVLVFLKAIMKADPNKNWTGYRIKGSLPPNGFPMWTFELFAKHPNSATEVFTGDHAPNVLHKARDSRKSLLDESGD